MRIPVYHRTDYKKPKLKWKCPICDHEWKTNNYIFETKDMVKAVCPECKAQSRMIFNNQKFMNKENNDGSDKNSSTM